MARRTPPGERIQFLFKLKDLLERNVHELARTITQECGKTLAESEGELRAAIENVEVATGIPSLMMGDNVEDIASGIDELMIRQPVGVVAVITPFNFPGMIPFWFIPYALACGNCVIVKPSEKTPITMTRVFELVEQLGLPPGVINMVHGGQAAVEALVDHPAVRAISFVGSSPVARQVYARAAARGKRAQCQGGAKNPIVVLPDADLDMTTKIAADSAFGCAGQRCLAASVAITVGDAARPFIDRIADAASSRRVGNGLDPASRWAGHQRTESDADRTADRIGQSEGARVVVDGRGARVAGSSTATSCGPTILEGVAPESELARTEVFGPVLSVTHVDSLEAAIDLINRSRLRQHGLPVHVERARGAALPLRGGSRQHRDQRWGRGADGVLPVLGLEGQFLRRPARAGTRCDRLLHGEKDRRRTLASGVEPPVLVGALSVGRQRLVPSDQC